MYLGNSIGFSTRHLEVCIKAIPQSQPRLCHTNVTSLTRCQDFKMFINKFPPVCCSGSSAISEALKAAGNVGLHGFEESTDEEEAQASVWTSSVLKKRRKKMNKHKYKKRKRRDRYKTKKK